MAYTLPSLNALRAFEAAARHLSFARAAEELCVTPGAISRHVAILEDRLGTQLFIREHRQVRLTPAATHYLRAIQDGFDRIDAATREFDAGSNRKSIRVIALPSFASRWLLPRMHLLAQSHPDLEIRLDISSDPVNFAKEQADLSIESAASQDRDMVHAKLADVELIPVCHPTLVNGRPPPSSLADLHNYTLLHAKLRAHFWPYWAEAVGLADIAAYASSYFPTSAYVYQAVTEGLGVGMGIRCLLEDDLAAGRLITPFDQSVTYPAGFYVNVPRTRLRFAHVVRFRDWLMQQAQTGTAAGLPAQQ